MSKGLNHIIILSMIPMTIVSVAVFFTDYNTDILVFTTLLFMVPILWWGSHVDSQDRKYGRNRCRRC